jgi:hypothetical protein
MRAWAGSAPPVPPPAGYAGWLSGDGQGRVEHGRSGLTTGGLATRLTWLATVWPHANGLHGGRRHGSASPDQPSPGPAATRGLVVVLGAAVPGVRPAPRPGLVEMEECHKGRALPGQRVLINGASEVLLPGNEPHRVAWMRRW